MDNTLAQQFLGLGRDPGLRKRNLLNLIRCLSHQEVRDLTAGLSAVDMRTDILSRLPPELRLNIVHQLRTLDVFPLLNVSKHWRAIWLQPGMLKAAAKHCLYIDQSLLSDGYPARRVEDDSIAVRYELLCRRRRRYFGMFSRGIVVRHDVGDGHGWLQQGLGLTGVFPPTPAEEPSVASLFSRKASHLEHLTVGNSLYDSGRLAWLTASLPAPDNTLIVVEDLYSKTKKIYRNSSVSQYGRDMGLKAMGDKLLVAGTSRVMFIWHLERNTCSQIFLPQQPSCCVTRGEYVAFLRRDSALLWKSGSELTVLDLDPLFESNRDLFHARSSLTSSDTMGIFFHPLEEGTLFISVCYMRDHQVVVHKFTATGYSGAQEIHLGDIQALSNVTFNENPGFDIGGAAISCWGLRPVNSSGDFLVAEWRTISPRKPLQQGLHTSGPTSVELRFNVNSSVFSRKEKRLPHGTLVGMQSLCFGSTPPLHSWNDQMIFALELERSWRLPGGAGLAELERWSPALVVLSLCPVTTANADARIHSVRPASNQPRGTMVSCTPYTVTPAAQLREESFDLSPPSSLKLVTDEDQPYWLKTSDDSTHTAKSLYSSSDFVLDLTIPSNFPEHGGRLDGPYHIFQDDDFIILFHRYGYMAWDFQTESAGT